jgi:hypothetical protein
MYRIRGQIEGIAPILFNRFTEQAVADMEAKKTGGRKTHDERMDEAYRLVYRDGHGLSLPPGNLKKCFLQGAQKAGLKEGRASAVPYLQATVFVEGELNFGKENPDFVHECTGRRPPRTGGACVIRRPALETGWRLSFQLAVMDDRRSAEHIKRAIEEAGLLVGLGDGRPDFGRFILTEWERLDG